MAEKRVVKKAVKKVEKAPAKKTGTKSDVKAASEADFEKATSYEIREEDIERAVRLVGIDTASSMRDNLTGASEDALRNFAHSYGDDNPLYCDPDYATHTRWGGQIAPPMILVAMNKPMLGDPLDATLKRPSFRGIHVFVSGGSTEWYRPIYPGDSIYSFGGFEKVDVKKSEFAERSVQITHRHLKINQRGEIVAIARILAIYTERKTAAKKGKYADLKPASYTDEDLKVLDAIYEQEKPRRAETRYWEDVEVGEPLPPMAKGPLLVTDLIVAHAGGYGFTPYAPTVSRLAYKNRKRIAPFYVKNDMGIPDVAQRVHWDSAWAQAIGNPMAYDYGVMRECWLAHFITDWAGDDGWLFRQSDEIRKFNYIGDYHIITGEVTDKRIEDGQCLVDIEMRGTNQRGDVTCPGKATVMLPGREHGPVILPTPPDDERRRAEVMFRRHNDLRREQLTKGKA